MTNKQIIQFDEFTREQLIYALKKYAMKELELDLGNFPAQFLFDFIVEEFGPHFYNQALTDIHDVVSRALLLFEWWLIYFDQRKS